MGLPRGVRSRRVPARNPPSRPGRYCNRRSRVLATAVSSTRFRLTRFTGYRFRWGPDRLDRVELGGVSRELEDRQPVPGRDQLPHGPADVRIQAVPDQDKRPTELLVRGIQQTRAVRLGEPLRFPRDGAEGRSGGHRTADHPVDLAVLEAGDRLDGRVRWPDPRPRLRSQFRLTCQ
jgi:hypothetical protein